MHRTEEDKKGKTSSSFLDKDLIEKTKKKKRKGGLNKLKDKKTRVCESEEVKAGTPSCNSVKE